VSDDYYLIKKLQDQMQQLEREVARQGEQLRGHDQLVATIAALVEILADAGQLDRAELEAHIRAAAIAASHEARDEARASQDVWDTAKGEP
jgi:hypothetical protein